MAVENSKVKLDLKSKKILYELDVNARQSYSEIGKKVGLSKDLVNYRMKQMEKSGLIKGYYVVLNIAKLGYRTFRVFMKFTNVTPAKENEIMEYLAKHPMVGWLVSVTGQWDTNMLVWAETVIQFKEFWDEFMLKYRNYVEEKWTSIVTELYQYRKAFILDKKRDETNVEIAGGELERNLDETDIAILKRLSANAREPLLDIGRNVGVSTKVVNYRIKRMIKDGVILSFRALLDLSLLGILYFKVHLTLQKMTEEKENQLLSYAHLNPNILFTDITVGGADFEVEIYAESNAQMHEIVGDIKNKFSDIIRSMDVLEYHKEYKWKYIPAE